MGASSPPRPSPGERASHDATCRAFVARATEPGRASSGPQHRTFVAPLTDAMARLVGREAGTPVIVRVRRPDALPVAIRTWQNEAEILKAVRGVLPHAPECLVSAADFAIHSFVQGVPLSSVCGNGKPVDALHVKALAGLLARLAQVRRGALPALPSVWPRNDTDSQGFLQTLIHLTDRQIRQPNRSVHGGLFAALGIHEDALAQLAGRVPAMARRPYGLLHADLNRDKVIVPYAGEEPLTCLDWELATYGDPLHDLATHLVRMRYPVHQRAEVVDAWAEAMQEVRPAAVNGLARDLGHYLAFERARSVFPDVMRAARSVEESFTQTSLDAAAAQVRRALDAAAEPLRLTGVPGEGEIRRALFRWLVSRTHGHTGGKAWVAKVLEWRPDRRVPQRPGFPPAAVREALLAEGAAPASRVFKGTAHLNTVVSVPGFASPVVVRRKLSEVCRRERGFLSEHAVLHAIEESATGVAAPRVLALGETFQGDTIALHTYVGPRDVGRPPCHPVHGLLPHEADCLVDQLCALTRVRYEPVDPTAGEGGFHHRLRDQLISLVRDLPKESRQLARNLGLPDADRLRLILSRHEVSHREPALLHGDLNPWNLVRSDDGQALALIDWEMAVVGDPLYDLVRHMHLTPTRPEIRDRMFRRWERLLPAGYTRDWRRDWRVYRWLEIVRSAYVDLDRLVTGASLDAPNVRRAVDAYAMTLAAATASLGLPARSTSTPYLTRALA
ncbi:aminoglycoside phosphotransferase family protein [Streptomyces sp. NPDC019990]|uniref:phosphotransferase family protein n=1 Tax=Streptomyces sp. NPDC019990 TaxID=3154693 RepID=UPI0033F9C9FE